MIKDLNVRPKTIKPLKKPWAVISLILALIFLFGSDTKAKATKQKIKKCDYIKLKSFCIAKETINKMKRQPSEWEKIFLNHISDKELISKIYKELMKLKPRNKPN